MDYLGKGEVLTNTDLWTIFVRNRPFVYIEKNLNRSLSSAHGKWGKSKSVALIILFSVCTACPLIFSSWPQVVFILAKYM